jgi:hypothetical protein
VHLTCNLNGYVGGIKGPYIEQPPSAIYSTEARTLEVLMTEKFHRQKISLLGSSFLQSQYQTKR